MDTRNEANESSSNPSPPTQYSELSAAYEHVREGRPMIALQVILEILRKRYNGDERRVFQTIQEAKKAHDDQNELESLARSLQEMSINQEKQQQQLIAMHKESILAEDGRDEIILDASSDDSSRVCPKCLCLISTKRFDQHVQFWCSKNEEDSNEIE